jgi:hypothetical protein
MDIERLRKAIEAAVVKAIVEERLTLADALAGGLLRRYPARQE